MSPAADRMAQLREQANQLYWSSGETVDQLATRLGMSRNAVYAAVRPALAGAACSVCDEPLVFTNRSSRAARLATCPNCRRNVTLADGAAATGTGPGVQAMNETGAVAVPRTGSRGRLSQLREDLAAVPAERAAMIGGAAALGVAIGAVAIKAIRRRS